MLLSQKTKQCLGSRETDLIGRISIQLINKMLASSLSTCNKNLAVITCLYSYKEGIKMLPLLIVTGVLTLSLETFSRPPSSCTAMILLLVPAERDWLRSSPSPTAPAPISPPLASEGSSWRSLPAVSRLNPPIKSSNSSKLFLLICSSIFSRGGYVRSHTGRNPFSPALLFPTTQYSSVSS